ncbi:unnamed protein product [Closterium sp. NIES-65]|nr:unnamed protein product [Closterium sp. NIES-65]
MPEIGPLDFDPIIAALSAVYSGDGSPASLAKERPEALKALSELLAFHMATSALNVAAIAAQFTADAGNLTTVNGQGLWINYHTSQSATLLNAYSPAQRALMIKGVLVADDDTTDGNDGTLFFPKGTTIAANGTVLFDPETIPYWVDWNGMEFYMNDTIVAANGTVLFDPADSLSWIEYHMSLLDNEPNEQSPPSNSSAHPQIQSAEPPLADLVLTEKAPRRLANMYASWGMWGMGGFAEWEARPPYLSEWSEEEQQQLASKATWWMNRMGPSPAAGSDMNVARVVWADVIESASMVVHGVDGVLFPRLRDNSYNNTNMTSNGTAANGTSDGKANGSSSAYGSGRADGSPANSRDSSGGSSSTVPTAGTAATGTPGNTGARGSLQRPGLSECTGGGPYLGEKKTSYQSQDFNIVNGQVLLA